MSTNTYSKTVYFDNAATTFPKPQSVIMSALDCMERYCGNPGRGSHTIAMMSSEKVFEAREAVAAMFGTREDRVVFTLNTTYALNMAIKGVMKGGGHAIISNMEHNSVLRPLYELSRDKNVAYSIFNAYSAERNPSVQDILDSIISKLRQDTKMLVCIHSSNICSYTLPLQEIGRLCRRHGIIFVVDAAQSAGHIDINMGRDMIDILCMPAHKGLYSPQGCGIMILGDHISSSFPTLLEGGNGYNSLSPTMGNIFPERMEAGTICTPAIAGLLSGIGFINSLGLDTIAEHEKKLWRRAYDRLSDITGVKIYDDSEGSVLLFNITKFNADDIGAELSERGFCLRSGYHCSPLAHKALKTPEGGALRIGFGIFNTVDEVDLLCDAVADIAKY